MPVDSEPIAVNTGPLIAMSACSCLEVLQQLHAQVVVPQAVLEEFVRGRASKPGDLLVQPPWLVVHALQSPRRRC